MIKTSKAGRYFGLIAVMLFLGLLVPCAALAAPSVWLSSPGNFGNSNSNYIAQKYAVVFYNPGSSAITVSQVDINNSDTTGYWSTVTTPESSGGTWSIASANDIRWTGTQSVAANATYVFYCTVYGSSAPGSATEVNLSATVTDSNSNTYVTAANTPVYESRSSYPTTINGYFANSTSISNANSPQYVLTNGGTPYAAGATVNFDYQLWSTGNNGGSTRYIVSACGSGTQAVITLPAGWGQPTNFTVPSIFNTPTVTGSTSTGWTITVTQNAATANFSSSAINYNIQFSATAPTTYTSTTASPVTVTYGDASPTLADYVESNSTSACGATGSYYTPINAVSNMAVMVAAGTSSTGTVTGAISTSAVTDTSFTVSATYTGDTDNDNSCAITCSGGTVSTPTVNRTTGTWTANVTGLSPNTAYTISATFTDSTGGVTGTNPLTMSQTTTNNSTQVGALTSTGVTDTSISVSSAFTGDANSNNTCTLQYAPHGTTSWTTFASTRGSGVYTGTATGLTPGTAYDFQAVYTDADGVTGSPATLSNVSTTNNGTRVGALTSTGATDTSISVSSAFTGDANSNNTCTLQYAPHGTTSWTTFASTKGSGVYTGTATGLTPGAAYDFQAIYTDADGVTGSPATLSNVSTTNNDTRAGALTSTGATDTSISVSSAFAGDANSNNTCTLQYAPHGTTSWTTFASTRGSGVYTGTATGLTPGTAYDFQAIYTDADGVTGSPATLSNVSTTDNNTYTGALTATTITTTSIAVQATYTGDANANNTCQIAYGTSSNGPWTNLTTTKGAGLYSATASSLTAGTTYYFQATFTDANGITGTNPLTLTQATNSANGTATGTMTATTVADTSISVQATYTGDANANNTCVIAYSTSVSGPWTGLTTTKGSGLYSATASGLTAGTTYYFQATFTDADGVTGTNPLTLTQATTNNRTTTGTMSATSTTNTSIAVQATYTGDTNANNTCVISYSTSVSGPWTGLTTTKGSGLYSATASGLTASTTYYFQAVFTDADGIVGSSTLTLTQATLAPYATTIVSSSATVNSSTQITATSTFTGDGNGNGSTAFAYGTSSSGPWTVSCSNVTGSSPRSCVITGLTSGTQYWVQVTYSDPDGITGANPQVIGPYTAATVCQSQVSSCTDCHSLPPNAGSHMIAEHEGNGTRSACAVCHFNYKTMTNVTSPRWTVGHFDNTMHIYTSNHINGGIKGGYYTGLRNRSSLWAGGAANSNNTCTATYCHGPNPSPVWGSTGITCTACHDAPPSEGSHAYHNNSGYIGYADASRGAGNYDFGCFKCHPKSTHAQGPATANSAAFVGPFSSISSPVTLGGTYVNGTSSQTDSRGFKWSDATCTNLYCHSNGQAGETGANVVYATPKWGNNTITCTSCHGQASTFATMTTTTGNHLSSSHAMHAATDKYAFNCSQCHNETVSSGGSIINTALHVNGVRDVHITSPSAAYTNMTGPFNSSGNTCSNVYCHSNGNGGAPNVVPQWGVTVTNCASCHNYKAPAAAMATGQHTYHINTPNIGLLKCYRCHAETVYTNDSTILYGNGKHVNGVKDVHFYAFNGISGVYNSSTKTCSNVYCHSSGQPASTSDGTPHFRVISSWTKTGVTYTCKSCHGADTTGWVSKFGEPSYANVSTAGRAQFNGHGEPGHVSFASDCSKCHYGTASVHLVGGFATITGTNHLNGTIDVNFRSDITGTWNATSKTCTNVSCHGPNSGTLRWGGHGNCQSCHGVNSNTEVDDFTFGNHTTATISMLQYTSVGHGKTGTYAYSGNAGANKQCTDCHTESTAHNTPGNPFRLISTNVRAGVYPSQPDTVCLYCHNSGIAVHNFHNTSTSYTGTYPNPVWLFTPKCVDCHDPHGDMGPNGRYNAYMMQSYINYTSGSDTYGRPASAYTPYRKALNFPADTVAKSYLTMTSFATPTFNGLCQICHTRGTNDTTGNNYPAHYNRALYGPAAGDGMTGVCTQCHAHSKGFSGAGGDCTGCHKAGGLATHTSPDNRRDIMTEFASSPSHHVVGTPTKLDCAACHAEGNYADGSLSSWHTGQAGHPVYLKVWTGGFPAAGTNGTFTVISTAPPTGSAAVFNTTKITPFCLSCHNDTNKTATPFSDGLTPTVYSWDFNSIGSKYSNISTTPWGKFNSTQYNVVPADAVKKAYSPHGNPGKNESVMSIAAFSTYSSTKAVACLDCHNAHASTVTGGVSYKSKNPDGGILNTYSTAGGRLRWRPTRFTPTAGGASATKNMYSASSDLCFSCHNGDNPAIAKNYSSFGLKRGMTVAGSYYDRVGNTKVWTNWSTTRWSTGDVWRGSFAYKDKNFRGGHFGNSLGYLQEGMTNLGAYEKNLGRTLVNSSGQGNCTACHDPHGVSTDWTTGSYSRPVRTLAMSNATSIPTVSISSYSGTNTGIYVVRVASTATQYQVSGDGGKTWGTAVSTGTAAAAINGVTVTLPSSSTYATDDTWTFIVGYSYITKQYMIPALKGTWMHSPYKEDRAPRNDYTTLGTGNNQASGNQTARLAGITYANDYTTGTTALLSSLTGRLWDDQSAGKSTTTSNRLVGGPAPRANPDFQSTDWVPGYNVPAVIGDGFGRGMNGRGYGSGYNNISSYKGWNGYFIDENTFGITVSKPTSSSNAAYRNMTTVNKNALPGNFAGLCLQCHAWTRNSGIALLNVTSSNLGTGTYHIQTKPHETVMGLGGITVNLYRREPSSPSQNNPDWTAHQSGDNQGGQNNTSGPSATPGSSSGRMNTNDSNSNGSNQLDKSLYYRWGVKSGSHTTAQATYHRYPCSKCHTPHVSDLPRLMKTNCLDNDDRNAAGVRSSHTAAPGSSTSYAHTTMPFANNTSVVPTSGTTNAQMWGALIKGMSCHSTKIGTYSGSTLYPGGWNNKTPW